MTQLDIDTVTVDSYSTLVDIDSQEAVLNAYVDEIDDPEPVSRLWRSQTLLYTVIANDIDAYRPFYELLGLGLEYALTSHGYDVPEETQDEIRQEVYVDGLTVFDDVKPGLERISDAGYPIYVLSNGNPEMLDHLVAAADIEHLIEDTISADGVETFKPDEGIYRHAAERTDTPIDRIVHVSGGTLRDVWGAKHAGMHAAWLHRPEKSYPEEVLGQEPDLTVTDFEDMADRLE